MQRESEERADAGSDLKMIPEIDEEPEENLNEMEKPDLRNSRHAGIGQTL